MSIVTATDDSTPVGVTSLQRRVRRWLTSSGRGGFVVLVVVFVIDVVVFSSLFGSRDPGRGMDWLIVPAIGAIGVALLAWRRRAPVLCYFAVWVHSIATQLIVPDYHPTVGLWVALAAVAQARSMWISLPLVALTFVPESFAIMQSGDQTEAQYRTSAITISIIAYGLFNCFAWAIGRWAARASARLDASEERRKADIAAERLQAEQAVAEERLRLARELHDIVAHAVTIMIIHSATASRLIHRDPGAAEEALDIVHLAGQQAVDELHRMLGLLRAVGSSAGLDADLPTLSDLPALVERTRAGGLKVELTGSGQPTSLDPSVQLAGYRVVQETLTNALKYSRCRFPDHCRSRLDGSEVDHHGAGRRQRSRLRRSRAPVQRSRADRPARTGVHRRRQFDGRPDRRRRFPGFGRTAGEQRPSASILQCIGLINSGDHRDDRRRRTADPPRAPAVADH